MIETRVKMTKRGLGKGQYVFNVQLDPGSLTLVYY
jgi:hypothetical protein